MGDNLQEVTLALDWTPNTNHLGFYYAKALGLYAKAGLAVKFLSTDDPVYQGSYLPSAAGGADAAKGSPTAPPQPEAYATPCSRVAAGLATFAINSPEGVVNWNTSAPGRPALKAIAAILQEQTSAIVTTKASGLSRPRDLDGKADATWVFMGWEGVIAARAGVELNSFYPQDFSVPYPYAPCLVAHPDVLAAQPDVVSAFLRASAEGWRAAAASPADAARALIKLAAEDSSAQLDAAVVEDSAAFVAGRCLDPAGRWGVMEAAKWDEYIDWLVDSGLLTTALQSRHPDAAADRVSLDDLREGWALVSWASAIICKRANFL
eukprot:jgi/Tetstr1/447591/TSEL_003743.t1